ncbi:MAG: patatin-like phospholipase family protein [Lachnospiraceae bacterium]
MKCCKGVFEGGGVRGIAHVGAACEMEQEGYRFESVAGSSAGAVVAALIASGYECRELKRRNGDTELPKVSWAGYGG